MYDITYILFVSRRCGFSTNCLPRSDLGHWKRLKTRHGAQTNSIVLTRSEHPRLAFTRQCEGSRGSWGRSGQGLKADVFDISMIYSRDAQRVFPSPQLLDLVSWRSGLRRCFYRVEAGNGQEGGGQCHMHQDQTCQFCEHVARNWIK